MRAQRGSLQHWFRGARRIAALTAALLVLSMVVVDQDLPSDGPNFPLSGLWSWLPARPGHAVPVEPGAPPRSRAVGLETYVSADVTTADGGAGGVPGRGVGALDPYVAPLVQRAP